MKKNMMISASIFVLLNCAQSICMDNQESDKIQEVDKRMKWLISQPDLPVVCKPKYTFQSLMVDNAAALRKMVAQERYEYCPSLYVAQKVVKKACASDSVFLDIACDKKNARFVRLIADKDDACNRLIAAIDAQDSAAVAATLTDNCYAAHHYFSCPEYGGRITPLHYVLSKAARNSDYVDLSVHHMHALLAAGANPNALDEVNNSPMHKSKTREQVDVLWYYGARSEVKNMMGRTPLMTMIWNGYTDVAQCLIGAHVAIDKQDSYGNTALHLAINRQDKEAVKYLLFIGVRFDIYNDQDKSPACYAKEIPTMKQIVEKYMQGDLWDALCANDCERIQILMKNYPWMSCMVKKNYSDLAIPILSCAREHCSAETVIFFENTLNRLLRAAVRSCRQKFSSLEKNELLRTIERLILSGASVNAKGCYGDCPLLSAAQWAEENLVLLLLHHGALITQPIINAAGSEEIRILLQQKYAEQTGIV